MHNHYFIRGIKDEALKIRKTKKMNNLWKESEEILHPLHELCKPNVCYGRKKTQTL
jgi:hypothetical protein